MSDPTYDKKKIEKNKVWAVAWIISETFNDDAPLGWSKSIPIAKLIVEKLSTKKPL